MASPQPPPVLNYNQPAPKRVLQVRHPPLATILLLLNTLLGAAMLLAVVFPDRLERATWIIIPTGALLIYVTLGCLSADRPHFIRAAVLASLACALAATATFLTYTAQQRVEAQILRGKSGLVTVYVESKLGGQWATLGLAWKICGVATFTGGGRCLFLAVRRAQTS
jgi:hypothetical protein